MPPTSARTFALTLARAAFALAAEVVAPSTCAACDAPVGMDVLFCRPCATSLERAPAGRPTCLAPFVYGGAVASALARTKYAGRPDIAPRLGRALGAFLVARAEVFGHVDVVVPVPMHAGRLATRGFDQASLIAGAVASALGVPRAARALVRLRDTPAQVGLSRSERLANVARAIGCRTPARLAGRRVLLVDDVITTGATSSACLRALREAGARDVLAAAVALRAEADDGP
jgi:ComF family protein